MKAQMSVALFVGTLLAAPLVAQDTLVVELNKVEASEGGGCSTYFLFRNGTGLNFATLELSLAILDGNGVINQLLTVDAAPVPAARTTLKLFDISGLACDDISELLVHDIPACAPEDGTAPACFETIALESLADVALVK
ncbi:MAG: hypothetical protein R8G34_15520 [Paracoccaceae bacterium]|nr:hypothetical protein [Paracoccaceae bacterium]